MLADRFAIVTCPPRLRRWKWRNGPLPPCPARWGGYYDRGDSACHESGLVNWLRDEQRAGGPRGRVGFAISARMSEWVHLFERERPLAML